MLRHTFSHLFSLIYISTLLTGCLGGGGGDSSENDATTELTDTRVATVTALVTDNFQRADGQSPITLTVIARDTSNAPLSEVNVSLATTSNHAVFIAPTGMTDANGRFTTSLVSSVAEAFEVTATAGGKRGEPVQVTFRAAVEQIELTASEEILAVGDSTTITVKIQQESTAEPLPNAPFFVNLSGNATVSHVPTTTDANGQATFTITAERAETVTVTVTSGTLAQTLTIYFGATLSLIPDSITVLDETTLIALLKDGKQVPIAEQSIQFNFIGNNNETLTPITAITRPNGTATVTITDLAKDGGTAIVQVTSGQLAAQATVTFGEVVVDPRIAQVNLMVGDNHQSANGIDKMTLTVVARDSANAPLADVPVRFISHSDTAIIQHFSGTTDEPGRFTTTVTNTVAETFEVTAIAGGVSTEPVSVTFIDSAIDPRVSEVKLLISDNSQRADGQATVTVTVTVRDANQAPVSNVAVNLIGRSDTAWFDTMTGTTDEQGRFTTTVTNTVAEAFEVTATAGGVPAQAATVSFVDGTIDPRVSEVKLLISDNSQRADGQATVTVTVIVHDANQAPVSNVAVNLIGSSDTAWFDALTGTTDEQGRFTTTVTNSQAEAFEVTATAGGVPALAATITFVDGTIDPRVSEVKLLISDNSQRADGQATVTVTVTVRDANQAPVSNVAVNLIGRSDTAWFDALTGTTDEQGRFTTTVTNTVAEAFEVTATAGGVPAQAATVSFVDGIIDPRVSVVSLKVTNNHQLANGTDPITLTVSVSDTQNAPLAGVPVNLISTSNLAIIDALRGTTDENGHFSTTVTSTVTETFQVTAKAGGVPAASAASVTFAPPIGHVVLRASSVILPANETSTVTVTLLKKVDLENILETFSPFFDRVTLNGPLLDNLLQQDILLPNTPFKVAASGNAVLGDVPEKTNQNGQASFTVTNNDNTVITVTSGPITETLRLHFGATLNLLPQSQNAVETATLTALLKDAHQAPIAEQPIQFNFVGHNNETLSPNTTITSADGTAQVTMTDIEKNGGTADVKVSSGTLTAQSSVNFLAVFGDNRHLQVKNTASVLNVNQSTTITAHITDNNDFPIQGQSVTFSVAKTDGGNSSARLNATNVRQVTAISDSEGEVNITVSDTVSENIIVTVRADTATQEIPLYFGATISLSPTEATGFANGSPITVTATVSDAQRGGIATIPVDFRITDGLAFLDQFRVTTNDIGQALVTVSSDTLGTATIEAQVDTLTPTVQATLTFNPSEPSRLTLTSSSESLSLNGETTITAAIKDAQGHSVKEGTLVQFTVTGAGTITASALTDQDGNAQATFSATTQAGLATITATAGAATDSLILTVQPGNAGTIEVSKIDPQVIGIIGSGVIQSTTIEFIIKDSLGNPVADGTSVIFNLGTTTLGGGETLSTEGDSGTIAIGRTLDGTVSVTLKSGAVAGNIDVIATVNDTVSTVARVTIVGSVPDADHLSLAVEFHNIAGGVRFGLQDQITAYIGDRFGNIVPDSTSVSFITEGGTIGTSIGGGAFTTTTEFGQATAILQSANPTTPTLGGIASLQNSGYQCSWPYALVPNASPPDNLCGNPGLVTIVAYSTGGESFIDANGNGQFDAGIDQHSHPGFIDSNGNQQWDYGEMIVGNGDLSEPYIDGNDNFTFDSGELYIDINNNGLFDGPDGIFQPNTTVWHSTRVLFSAQTRSEQEGLTITPNSFSIPNGGSETFIVSNISDIYGNALVKGSRVKVTTNHGVLGGTTDLTFGDNIQAAQAITFTLSSVPCQTTDDNGQVSQNCPLPESATITVTITSSGNNQAPGGNGDESLVISGVINL